MHGIINITVGRAVTLLYGHPIRTVIRVAAGPISKGRTPSAGKADRQTVWAAVGR